MTLTGIIGRIEWGYYVAAAIEGYTVTGEKDNTWRLTATVVLSDPFKLAQRPLRFVAPHAKGVWTWPVQTLHVEQHGRVTARLGPPV